VVVVSEAGVVGRDPSRVWYLRAGVVSGVLFVVCTDRVVRGGLCLRAGVLVASCPVYATTCICVSRTCVVSGTPNCVIAAPYANIQVYSHCLHRRRRRRRRQFPCQSNVCCRHRSVLPSLSLPRLCRRVVRLS
jgi:hypothetical protein